MMMMFYDETLIPSFLNGVRAASKHFLKTLVAKARPKGILYTSMLCLDKQTSDISCEQGKYLCENMRPGGPLR